MTVSLDPFGTRNKEQAGLGGNNPVVHSLSKGEYVLQHAILQSSALQALSLSIAEQGKHPIPLLS